MKMDGLTLQVTGMTCQGCVNAVTRALGRVAPQARVEVDLATGRVAIEGAVEPSRAAEAIRAAGFEVAGQNL
ncbi:MAG: heavy-metal-associated domain-containing protein [Alphaproteobacteria bacterium]|nr:heavy-metal-associated domain-containing protein [Alphaproteobacteria bacterium]